MFVSYPKSGRRSPAQKNEQKRKFFSNWTWTLPSLLLLGQFTSISLASFDSCRPVLPIATPCPGLWTTLESGKFLTSFLAGHRVLNGNHAELGHFLADWPIRGRQSASRGKREAGTSRSRLRKEHNPKSRPQTQKCRGKSQLARLLSHIRHAWRDLPLHFFSRIAPNKKKRVRADRNKAQD